MAVGRGGGFGGGVDAGSGGGAGGEGPTGSGGFGDQPLHVDTDGIYQVANDWDDIANTVTGLARPDPNYLPFKDGASPDNTWVDFANAGWTVGSHGLSESTEQLGRGLASTPPKLRSLARGHEETEANAVEGGQALGASLYEAPPQGGAVERLAPVETHAPAESTAQPGQKQMLSRLVPGQGSERPQPGQQGQLQQFVRHRAPLAQPALSDEPQEVIQFVGPEGDPIASPLDPGQAPTKLLNDQGEVIGLLYPEGHDHPPAIASGGENAILTSEDGQHNGYVQMLGDHGLDEAWTATQEEASADELALLEGSNFGEGIVYSDGEYQYADEYQFEDPAVAQAMQAGAEGQADVQNDGPVSLAELENQGYNLTTTLADTPPPTDGAFYPAQEVWATPENGQGEPTYLGWTSDDPQHQGFLQPGSPYSEQSSSGEAAPSSATPAEEQGQADVPNNGPISLAELQNQGYNLTTTLADTPPPTDGAFYPAQEVWATPENGQGEPTYLGWTSDDPQFKGYLQQGQPPAA